MNYLLVITVAFLAVVTSYGQGSRYADAYLTSSHLMPGEQAILWVSLHGATPDGHPAAPEVEGAAVNFIQAVTRISSNRQLTQVYAYRVSAPNPGKYVIPPITVTTRGRRYLTSPLLFRVHPESHLQTVPTGIGGNSVKIGWFPEKTTLYQGETCPVLLKVYAPSRLRVANFGLPDPQKENSLAWRFSLPDRSHSSMATIGGKTHQVMGYSTTLSGIAPGKAALGPSKLRLIIRERTIVPRIGPTLRETPVHLTIPKLEFNILPLPPGAPGNFNGAVGTFRISATCGKTTLEETGSTEVVLHVEGTGNLPTVKPPAMVGETWKVIDTSKVTRGEERRFTTGRVTFRQLIRPASASATSIPAYAFSYFDPADKQYHSLSTPPIPVSITRSPGSNATPSRDGSASSARPAPGTPPEKMQDILGFIDMPDPLRAPSVVRYSPFYHLVPAAIGLLIIAIALRQRHRNNLLLNPGAREKKRALASLGDAPDTRTFYRRAGRIIERWHPGAQGQPQLRDILAERDAVCFQPDGSPAPEISPDRKNAIIALLKRSTTVVLTLLALLGSPSTGKASETRHPSARDAWKSGDYQQALEIYQKQFPDPGKTPPDVLYNIGNCHYRLGQPGYAALAWRRALHADPTHTRARNNLRFVEIQQGATAPTIRPWQSPLAFTRRDTFRTILCAAGWTAALAILTLFLYLRSRKILTVSLVIASLAGIATAAAGFALHFYPDAHSAGPPERHAVTLTETPIYPDAHRTTQGPAPNNQQSRLAPASLVIITARRGPWTHITTPDNQQGWVETKTLGKITVNNPG